MKVELQSAASVAQFLMAMEILPGRFIMKKTENLTAVVLSVIQNMLWLPGRIER